MDNRFDWLEAQGISVKDGLAYTGGADQYAAALQRYYRGYTANRKAVEDFFAAGDLENYTVKVHALKSNSRMIGAMELASAFEALELAGRRGDTAYIAASTAAALALYERVAAILRPIGEQAAVKVPGAIDAAEARLVSSKLLEALDDFDDETSAELAAKLAGYPFRPTQKGKLREAANYIGDFMYDEAAELIREIVPAIE